MTIPYFVSLKYAFIASVLLYSCLTVNKVFQIPSPMHGYLNKSKSMKIMQSKTVINPTNL